MATINKLNKTVVAGERTRATDFNAVSGKVDEIVQQVNTNTATFPNKANVNHTHTVSDIGGLSDLKDNLIAMRKNGYGIDTYSNGNHLVNMSYVTDLDIGSIISCYVESFASGDTISFYIDGASKGGGAIMLNNQPVGDMEVGCYVTFLYFPGNVKIIAFSKSVGDTPFKYWLSIESSTNGSVTFTTKKVSGGAKITGYTVTPDSGYSLLYWYYTNVEGLKIKFSNHYPPNMPYHDMKLTPVFGEVGSKQMYVNIPNHVSKVYVMSETTDLEDTLTSSGYIECYEPNDKLYTLEIYVEDGYSCTGVEIGSNSYDQLYYNSEKGCFYLEDTDLSDATFADCKVLSINVEKSSSTDSGGSSDGGSSSGSEDSGSGGSSSGNKTIGFRICNDNVNAVAIANNGTTQYATGSSWQDYTIDDNYDVVFTAGTEVDWWASGGQSAKLATSSKTLTLTSSQLKSFGSLSIYIM